MEFRNRHQAPGGRFLQAGHIHGHFEDHPGFHLSHARDGSDTAGQGFRGPFDLGEDLGKPVIPIIIGLGNHQRLVGAAHGDIGGHPAGHHQHDRDDLTGQVA